MNPNVTLYSGPVIELPEGPRRTTYQPRRNRDRSKYKAHQSTRERMRRVGQALRGIIKTDEHISNENLAEYLDYATAKAAGQDLTRFRQPAYAPPLPKRVSSDYKQFAQAPDAQLPEAGADPTPQG